jgi:hypothetical protein
MTRSLLPFGRLRDWQAIVVLSSVNATPMICLSQQQN